MTSTTIVPDTELTKTPGSGRTTESNVPVVASQLMTIDVANAGFIMDTLTNLYSNPIGSVIREYIANALDSHIMADNDDPINVTIPTSWEPTFTVQDFGVGMSRDDIFSFGSYGVSSKRENLNVVGAFGMGSKSGLAVSDSFTVTGIKDGEKTIALIHRNEAGAASIDIIGHETGVDAHNGVTISIPVPMSQQFRYESNFKEMTEFIDSGKISCKGKLNESALDGLHHLSDDVLISSNYQFRGLPSVTLVVGGFGYEVSKYDSDLYKLSTKNLTMAPEDIFIIAPVGSVDLTPSREDLRYTSRTKKMIDDTVSGVIEALENQVKEVQEGIVDLSTALEAEKALGGYKGSLIKNLLHMRDDITSTLFCMDIEDYAGAIIQYAPSPVSVVRRYNSTSPHTLDHPLVVVKNDAGFKIGGHTTTKIRDYVRIQKNINENYVDSYYLIVDDEFDVSGSGPFDVLKYRVETGTSLDLSDVYTTVRDNKPKKPKTPSSYDSSSVRTKTPKIHDRVLGVLTHDGDDSSYSATKVSDIPGLIEGDNLIYVINKKKSDPTRLYENDLSPLEDAHTAVYGVSRKVVLIDRGSNKESTILSAVPGSITLDDYIDGVYGSKGLLDFYVELRLISAKQSILNSIKMKIEYIVNDLYVISSKYGKSFDKSRSNLTDALNTAFEGWESYDKPSSCGWAPLKDLDPDKWYSMIGTANDRIDKDIKDLDNSGLDQVSYIQAVTQISNSRWDNRSPSTEMICGIIDSMAETLKKEE